MARVLFANSGSESNDTAFKLVRYYNNAIGRPAKKKIIARVKGYHGVTVAAASLSGLPMMHQHFDLPIDGVVRVGCPHAYQFAHDGESPEQFAARLARRARSRRSCARGRTRWPPSSPSRCRARAA